MGYRFAYPDVKLKIGIGKPLYENTYFEVGMIRSFNEIDIGFHSRWYDLQDLSIFTGGFSLSVPIPFFQHWSKSMIVRSSRHFSWGIWYHELQGGKYPKSRTSVENFHKKLFPTYIQNNTELIIN